MDDDSLVRLWERPGDLTEEAKAALVGELGRRNIGETRIREKLSRWREDAEEDRQRVVVSRRSYIRGKLGSLLQLGVILGVGIAYAVLLSVVFRLSWAAEESLDKLMAIAAFAIWGLVRTLVPRWKITRIVLAALAGYIVATGLMLWMLTK